MSLVCAIRNPLACVATPVLMALTMTPGSAVADTATPSHAVGKVIHGTWWGGKSTHLCAGSTTNFVCRHTADSTKTFAADVNPICIETDANTGAPLKTGCSAVLNNSEGTYVRSSGAGVVGACSTTRAAASVPTLRVVSRALNGAAFDVPVNIINSPGMTDISGTLFQLGVTIHVAGRWTHGCGDPTTEGAAVGTWYGTFEIAV
jgi:hypothetical protein